MGDPRMRVYFAQRGLPLPAPNNPHNGQIAADLGDIGLTRTPDAIKGSF